MLNKKVTKNMILDGRQCGGEYVWMILISLLRIHSQGENFETRALLLLL